MVIPGCTHCSNPVLEIVDVVRCAPIDRFFFFVDSAAELKIERHLAGRDCRPCTYDISFVVPTNHTLKVSLPQYLSLNLQEHSVQFSQKMLFSHLQTLT